jgi:hypothetical protein
MMFVKLGYISFDVPADDLTDPGLGWDNSIVKSIIM